GPPPSSVRTCGEGRAHCVADFSKRVVLAGFPEPAAPKPRKYFEPRRPGALPSQPRSPRTRMARVDRVTMEASPDKARRPASRASVVALCLAAAVSAVATGGCRVNEDNIHRWESTEHGPDKLRAVLYYDKYDNSLRVEAALSLIRMKPRAGRRIGINIMVDTLASIAPEARQAI